MVYAYLLNDLFGEIGGDGVLKLVSLVSDFNLGRATGKLGGEVHSVNTSWKIKQKKTSFHWVEYLHLNKNVNDFWIWWIIK